LGSYPIRLTDCIEHWARHAPDRVFLAQRSNPTEWRRISYAEFRWRAREIARWLIRAGLNTERPVAILSGNDIEHALLAAGAMYAGIPYSPISPAYSLMSSDFARLRHIFDLLTPGLVYASDGAEFARAIEAVVPEDVALVVKANPPRGRETLAFADLVSRDERLPEVSADSVAKILFTSGSTRAPKGVITTHRMLTSNQEMLRTVFPFFAEDLLTICDWLPWNHTFGGSHNFGIVLYNGGTMYIDGGRPVEGGFEDSIANFREIAPTVFFNVPKGYEMLIPHLRRDAALRERFFSRLRMMFYAAAGLSQQTWDELDRLSIETCGRRIPMLTGLGATETAPFALCASAVNRTAGVVGLPVPGVKLKLAPVDHKLEARVKGPNVTPGYWRQPELTAAVFDDEGYYRLGDALRFVDSADPSRGFLFEGRLSEDFKLSTGTWVSVGPLRTRFLMHFAPYAKDVVIAGHDRGEVTALIFPDMENCRGLESQGALRAEIEKRLCTFAAHSSGSSMRVERAIVLDEPPSLDGGELTDKGTVNQCAVLERRASIVERLYTAPYGDGVLCTGDAIKDSNEDQTPTVISAA
jgi:feruloyl-CoA synthase